MFNDSQIYEIVLEDYSRPRYAAGGKSYFGSLDDIIEVMVSLEENHETCTRYAELADAIAYYDRDEEMTHVVNGERYSLLSEVDVLARNDVHLEKKFWTYTGCSGASYPMYADEVAVSQVIIRDEMGSIIRCIRAEFTGLRTCAHGVGWYCMAGYLKGFPGMVSYKDGKHIMNLYAQEQVYGCIDLEEAMADLIDCDKIDLQTACKDIFGEV